MCHIHPATRVPLLQRRYVLHIRQGSRVRPIWSHVRPNFSRVRLTKIPGRTGASSHSRKENKSIRDSETLVQQKTPPLGLYRGLNQSEIVKGGPPLAADFALRRVLWRHRNAHSVKERLFLSSKNGMNSFAFSSCTIYKSYIGQTNRKRNKSALLVWATDRLSARTGAAGCSRSRDTVIHSAGRYSEESSRISRRIHNISVRSCEKHSNSAHNYVKATDIRTNSTDVENRRNVIQ